MTGLVVATISVTVNQDAPVFGNPMAEMVAGTATWFAVAAALVWGMGRWYRDT